MQSHPFPWTIRRGNVMPITDRVKNHQRKFVPIYGSKTVYRRPTKGTFATVGRSGIDRGRKMGDSRAQSDESDTRLRSVIKCLRAVVATATR